MLERIRHWSVENRRFVTVGLALTIALQLTVLATEYLTSVWPLWFGTPVVLKTAPIDPRSLFRGNYVRLNYDVSTVTAELADHSLRRGEVGYVTLRQEGEFHVATGLQRERPATGPFLRGRVERDGGGYRLRYGIEAFFMPKRKALETERSVRDGARAEVYILDNGRAAIARLICDAADC